MKKMIVLLLANIGLINCSPNTSPKVSVPNETLIVASKGQLLNFNLETKKLTWEFTSTEDVGLNRNQFTYDSENIYLPFESGKFVSIQINSGKKNWIIASSREMIGITDAYIDEDGSVQTDNPISDNGPIFMSKPLLANDYLYIASAKVGYDKHSEFIVLNKKDGTTFTVQENSTFYNYFAPVENNTNVYVNSATNLDMHYQEGTLANYGLFEKSAFEHPLYTQMQTSKNMLFLGDEKGKFYALEVDKVGLVKRGDISDPKNNFIDRKDLFEWTYQSSKYPYLGNSNTALTNNLFIVHKKSEDEKTEALIALDSKSGKESWLFEPNTNIINWQVVDNNEILAYSKSKIYVVDLRGNLVTEMDVDPKLLPISNIEVNKAKNLIYLSYERVVLVNRETKKPEILIPYTFKPHDIESNQIKYFN